MVPTRSQRSTGWAEVRVHGVSGTPPHDMLDLAQPAQADRVAGDDTTGFYVRRPDAPVTPGTECPAGVHLEAFSWGALTSGARGAWARALWLLLVPFALANVAYWSRPGLAAQPGAGDPDRRGPTFCRDGAGAAAVRAGAVLLTAVFAASVCVVGVDVLALQCLSSPSTPCAGIPGFVSFTSAGYWAGTGRLVALGLLVPLAAVAVVWLLGRRTEARYEQTADPSQAEVRGLAAIVGPDVGTPHLLQQPDLWQGEARVARLRQLHLAAALGVVVAFAGTTVVGAAGGAAPGWFGLVGGCLLVAGAALVAVVQRDDGPDGRTADGRPRPLRWAGVPRTLAWAALAAVAVQVLLLLVSDVGPPAPDRASRWIPLLLVVACAGMVALLGTRAFDRRWAPVVAALAVVATTVLAAVLAARTGAAAWALLATVGLVVAVPLHRRDDPVRRAWMWDGAAPGVFLGGGLFVAVLYSTAAVMGSAAFLGGGVGAVTASASRLAPPPVYAWFAAAVVVTLVLAALLVGGWWWVTRRMRPAIATALDADDAAAAGSGVGRAGRLRARTLAARLRRGEDLLGLVAMAAAAAGLVSVAGTLSGLAPGQHGLARLVTAAGAGLSVLAAVGLVLLGRALGSGEGLRRGVGILWDLSGFWPRCAHPFAPPCYAERAVPDLYTRATFHLAEHRGLLLSGHSLGGVLSVAVLVRLPADGLQRTALLTYGSQLRQYFGRGFPGVFGAAVMGALPAARLSASRYEYPGGVAAQSPPAAGSVAALLAVGAQAAPGRWRSLFRRTDPLGFPVYENIAVLGQDAGARVDRVTTEAEAVPAGDPRPPQVQTHGGYTRTVEYVAVRAALLDAIPG